MTLTTPICTSMILIFCLIRGEEDGIGEGREKVVQQTLGYFQNVRREARGIASTGCGRIFEPPIVEDKQPAGLEHVIEGLQELEGVLRVDKDVHHDHRVILHSFMHNTVGFHCQVTQG